jgi:hypothetical protein
MEPGGFNFFFFKEKKNKVDWPFLQDESGISYLSSIRVSMAPYIYVLCVIIYCHR